MFHSYNLNFNELQNKLLGSDETATLQALDVLHNNQDIKTLEAFRANLVVVHQLHLDDTVKEKSKALLATLYTPQQLAELDDHFEIFRSISTLLPWGGQDYTPIQAENYRRFRLVKSEYDNTLSRFAHYTEFYIDLARKLYMLFQLEQAAQEIFETILRYNQQNDEVFYSLGRILEKQTNFQPALDYYQKALGLNPQHLYALLQAGQILTDELLNYPEAINYYQKAVELEPYAANTNVALARAHYLAENYDRAQQFVEIALSINEFHEPALDLLGTIEWRIHKNVDKALEIYQKGLDNQTHGDSGLLLGSMAELYTECLQDFAKGRLYYEKSLAALPYQPQRLLKYTRILTNDYKDYALAQTTYQRFLEQFPHHPLVKSEYESFESKYLKNIQPVVEDIQPVFTDNPNDVPLNIQFPIHVEPSDNYTDEPDTTDEDEDDEAGGAAESDSDSPTHDI